ncbi:MAG: helix-turn-helix domain-containing protein [Anaerolineae bacterium]|nr:helix-turn-helix domain-containing protein [Anaerolineae bacterium]MCP5428578.1 helix-turn-helix domain-containing protein [Chromatiaceae bacterium]
MNTLSVFVEPRGAAAKLARILDVSPVLISQWANGVRRVPAERCPDIERATGGVVRCEDLRPDIDWSVLRDSVSEIIAA